ncbi:DUF317 domain-containing protein [Streptomyces sp. NPDC093249]|uniref:DUF317 domain-containing protein n=1 Tax=unclassified Streptomyces TaxID=2593676 RepID=UPI00344D0379
MPHAPADAHIRLALHPDRPPAVIATCSGTTADAAEQRLHGAGFRKVGATMVLARIDQDEPYYAVRTAEVLRSYGFTVTVDPALQEEADTEWEWANHPFPWCTQEEIREVSAAAQAIHDDIAAGRLIIRFHAHDGHTTVAVGTYTAGVQRHIHLHGENHVRQVTERFTDETQAIGLFHRLNGAAVRPGPAPLTDQEKALRDLLAPAPEPASTEPTPHLTPTVAVAGPGDHEALLATLFETGSPWERYRPFDETTIASHESLTVRVEFDHEALHRADIAWTIAEYDGPVGERLWHATITAGTPVALIETILRHLDRPPHTIADPATVLRTASWTQAGHHNHEAWTAPTGQATVACHVLPAPEGRWILHAGADLDRAAWTIRLSRNAPQDLVGELISTVVDLAPLAPAPALQTPPALRLPPAGAQRHTHHR